MQKYPYGFTELNHAGCSLRTSKYKPLVLKKLEGEEALIYKTKIEWRSSMAWGIKPWLLR